MCPIYWDPFLKKKKIGNTVRSYTGKAEHKYVLVFSAAYIRVAKSVGRE
jgi:hypothetical protein